MFTVWRNFYTAMFQKKYLDSVSSAAVADPGIPALPCPAHRTLTLSRAAA